MKQFITLVTAAVLLVTSSAFAASGPESTNSKVQASFLKDFAGATQVNWETKDNFQFADFTYNNARYGAAYNEEGVLVATSRSVKADQLPLAVTLAIKEKYAGYQTAGIATEVVYENSTSYYITVANESQVLRLKASAAGDLSVDSKAKR